MVSPTALLALCVAVCSAASIPAKDVQEEKRGEVLVWPYRFNAKTMGSCHSHRQ